MLAVVVTLQAKPGHEEQALEAAQRNAATSREIESGCKQFDVVQLDAAGLIQLIEQYDDEDAIRTHMTYEHYREWRASVDLHFVPGSMTRTAGVVSN